MAAFPVATMAQQAQSESVKGRARPEYNPLGIKFDDAMRLMGRVNVGRNSEIPDKARSNLGSYLLNTRLELETTYDDNVFRKETGKKTDTIFRLKPSFTIGSDWANHQLKFRAGAVIGRYLDNETEDYVDFNAGIGGKLDMDVNEFATLDLGWSRNHEDRGSPDDTGTPEPNLFHTTSLTAGYDKKGGRLYTRLTGKATYSDYQDNGSTNHDDRDRLVLEGRARLGTNIDEGTRAYGEVAANSRIYDEEFDDGGKRRDSKGYEALLGVVWDYSGVTFLDFGFGYLAQDFEESTFPTISGASFQGRMVWNPTGLLTATLGLRRSIAETTQSGTSGILNTTYNLVMDWEARNNLILSADGSFRTEEFRGGTREDETTEYGIKGRWMLGQNWYVQLDLRRIDKDSSASGSSYENNRFMVTIGEQL